MFKSFNDLKFDIEDKIIEHISKCSNKDALCELHKYSWLRVDLDIQYCGG